jgi:hypothetical protein
MVKQSSSKSPKGRKKKAAEPETKLYEYGNLAVVCSCGSVQILGEGVEQGIQITLVNKEDSFIQLRCDKCNADIKLCLLEGIKPEVPLTEEDLKHLESEEPNTEITDEVIQEESKEESVL